MGDTVQPVCYKCCIFARSCRREELVGYALRVYEYHGRLVGPGELSALRLLFLRPNPAALEAMNSALLRRMSANTHSVHCSEVAEKLFDAADRGEILRMSPIKRFGSINVEENGQVLPYDYHEVYSDGNFVFDPRLNPQPVRLTDWYNQVRQLNPGGVNIGPR